MYKIMKRLFFLLSLVVLVGCTCLAQNVNDQLLDVNENCEAVVPNYLDDVTVLDNCDPNVVPTQSPAAGTVISVSQTCTITATDLAGNENTLVFNLVLNDTTPPVITPIGDLLSMREDETVDTLLASQ